MEMTVKGFSEKYKTTQQAVYAKIKRKSAQLDGHVTKSGGQLVIDEYAEECLKPKCADFTLVRKIQKLQNCLDDRNFEIEKLQSQLAEGDLKKSSFDNFADMLKNEILKISDKIDNVQNSIFENTKKNGSSIIGLLKKQLNTLKICKFNRLNLW